MLVVMKPHATQAEVAAVADRIRGMGFTPHPIPGAQRVAIGVTGNKGGIEVEQFQTMPGVADAIRVSQPFKLVSREVKEEDTVIDVGGVPLGGKAIVVMAGPCSVESREQLLEDVWEMSSEVETRTVDTHVKRLREKLGSGRDLLETVRGIGYRLVDPGEKG